MNPVTIVGGFLSGFLNYLQQKRTQHSITSAFDSIDAVNNWVGRIVTAIADYQGQEQGAVQFSAQYAKQIGHDFEQIEGDWEAIFTRLTDTVIPHTLAYLVGYVWSNGITPLNQAMRAVQGRVTDLETWEAGIKTWRNTRVDPLLTGYQQFVQWWDANFAGPALTLIDWLAHPADFGTWAAPPVIGPIVAYLADPGHEQTRDNLTQILVSAWQEVPNPVWESILAFMVTEK